MYCTGIVQLGSHLLDLIQYMRYFFTGLVDASRHFLNVVMLSLTRSVTTCMLLAPLGIRRHFLDFFGSVWATKLSPGQPADEHEEQ